MCDGWCHCIESACFYDVWCFRRDPAATVSIGLGSSSDRCGLVEGMVELWMLLSYLKRFDSVQQCVRVDSFSLDEGVPSSVQLCLLM